MSYATAVCLEQEEEIGNENYHIAKSDGYCLSHQETFQELWPDLWLCESCLLDYYGENHD